MAALNFPSNPSLNQEYTPVGGPTWVFNGEAWDIKVAGAVISVNGNTGEVTLDAADVGAVPSTGGSFTGAVSGPVIYGTVAALTSGASITPDFSVSNNFSLALGINTTLNSPTNAVAGMSGAITITQTAGTFTMAFGSNWKFEGGSVPTLTATSGAVDVLVYYVESPTRITAKIISDAK